MGDQEEFQSAMSFWLALDNLATVDEDIAGEELEELRSEAGNDTDPAGILRLNSEGEEVDEEILLDEEYLTCLTGRGQEDSLFLTGLEYEEEYFESLSGLGGNKEQKCNFCQVCCSLRRQEIHGLIFRIFSMKT